MGSEPEPTGMSALQMKTIARATSLITSLLVVINSSAAARGRVVFEGPIASKLLGTNRTVRVCLPAGYETSRRRYPVLYIHDGQNAFSTVGDHVAFGWGNWRLDQTVDALAAAGKMRQIILVAVDCSAQRYLEYRGPAYPYS